MKALKYISSICIALLLFINCSQDDNDLGFVNNVTEGVANAIILSK